MFSILVIEETLCVFLSPLSQINGQDKQGVFPRLSVSLHRPPCPSPRLCCTVLTTVALARTQHRFGYLGDSVVPYETEDCLFDSCKKCHWVFRDMELNLQITLHSMDVLTILRSESKIGK